MVWLFRKKKRQEVPTESNPWAGDRADAEQLDVYLGKAGSVDQETFMSWQPDVQAIASTFRLMIKRAAEAGDRRGALEAWRYAQGHVANRLDANKQYFASKGAPARAAARQSDVFYTEAQRLFGANSFVTDHGKRFITTRVGGGIWALKQATLVLLNPVTQIEEVSKSQGIGGGRRVVSVRKTYLHLDPGLFSDFIKLTPEGIVISNPDLGLDEYLLTWDLTGTIQITTNAAAWVDPINEYIRPLSKKTAQSPWVPMGTLTIKDRQSGQLLVTIVMLRPAEFREKLEKLIAKLKTSAVVTTDVKPEAPIDLWQCAGVLTGDDTELVRELLQNTRRRYATHVVAAPRSAVRGSTLITFQGKQLATVEELELAIQEALAKYKREPTRQHEFMRSLQELAKRMRPYVGKSSQKLLDQVINLKLK